MTARFTLYGFLALGVECAVGPGQVEVFVVDVASMDTPRCAT
jgi:hypothetical protein